MAESHSGSPCQHSQTVSASPPPAQFTVKPGNIINICLLVRMLFHYLDHKRKESSGQLNATYLVSGKFVDNGQAVRYTID